MESALKVYGQSWRDPEKAYRERRWSIRQHLQSMPASALKKHIQDLNEDLDVLKAEIKECKDAISVLKRGEKPELLKFGIHPSISESTESLVKKLKAEVASRKQIAKWILRERAIYLWELRLRRAKAVKLPILKQRRKTLRAESFRLLFEAKECVERLQSLCEDYFKTVNEYYHVTQQMRFLDVSGSSEIESESPMSFPVPPDLIRKLNNAFMNVSASSK
jgi:hypothetical protein